MEAEAKEGVGAGVEEGVEAVSGLVDGRVGRSLRPFARTAYSAHLLITPQPSAPLRYARSPTRSLTNSLTPFVGSLTHFAHFVHAVNVFCGNERVFLSSLETRPQPIHRHLVGGIIKELELD